MGKHSQPGPSRRQVMLASGAVLLVAVGVFAVTRAAASGVVGQGANEAPAATSVVAAPASARPAKESSGQSATQALLAECLARQAAAQPVVTAATTGVGHWRDHIQGQNDIEAGVRTKVEVKVNTWAPTRAAGPGDVAAYETASAGYAGTSGCTAAAPADAAGEVKTKIAACLDRQHKLDAYLGAAAAVMTDWRNHLVQMGQHSAGEVDSIHALDNWLAAWRSAPTNLTPYAAAEAALASAPSCQA